MLIEDTFRK